jgi:DNA-binding NtrC family response regulator
MSPKMPSVLVVDDTPANIGFLLETLSQDGYSVRVAQDGESALEQARYAPPCLILLDVMMPGMDGFETCRRLRQTSVLQQVPVIFMTALSSAEDKVQAFAVGADDYVTKPFQQGEVLARVRVHIARRQLERRLEAANQDLEARVTARTAELHSALAEVHSLRDRLQLENSYLQQEIAESAHYGEIVGNSPALQGALKKVELVAPTDSTVLIHGETGTGKELIARALHERSHRRTRTLVKLNCSAISSGLVESELFGHVKGAFTGASDRRVGRFELAHQGTLFLDEVGELPLETQAKLLRVLQEREFEPVGSSKPMRVDVRLIAATNRDLAADARAGRFRADLYYRLNVFPVELPPLRDRREDIAPLARHFLHRMARKLGKPLRDFTGETLTTLSRHSWPGNIRDLQNTIERAAILAQGEWVSVDWGLVPDSAGPTVAGEPAIQHGLPSLEARERMHIVATLRKTRGIIDGQRGAARLLAVKPSTLRFRMRKLGISKPDFDAD